MNGEGLIGVWDTTEGSIFIKVPGTNDVVLRQRFYGSGTEPLEGASEMGMSGENLGKGGSE